MIKFCPFCGSKVIPNAKFCVECGKSLKMINIINEEDNTQKNVEKIDTSSHVNEDVVLNDNKVVKEEQETLEISEEPVEKPKVSKSFKVLNQKTKNQKEKQANFDLVRPSSEMKVMENNQDTNSQKTQHSPQKINNVEVNATNTKGFSCPSCGRNMHLSQTSGFLSKATYHQCSTCSLKFKENDNLLLLEEEPQLTRMSSKLHLKKYTLTQWEDIFKGNYPPDFSEEFEKWKFDSPAFMQCPACNHDLAKYKSQGFGSKTYVICPGCGLILNEQKNNQYVVYECVESFSPLWKYGKTPLSLEDMKRIIHTEESEENRLFREAKVKENELKIKEHQLKIKQEEDDLALFAESIESGKPMLPVPSDTTIVLKKNEVPVYRMNNVTLSEPRAVRTSSGGYGGASVRIAKGVTIHSGRTASKSESHDEIKLIDSGELLITNQRVIFLGSNRTTNIEMKKIISITSGARMIQIQRSNKQKPEYFNNIHAEENFEVDGRKYSVTIDGDMLKKLIMGLI